jgi:hypothetical protein
VKTWLKEEIWTEMSEAPVGALDRMTSAIERSCSSARLCSNTCALERIISDRAQST